MDARFTSQPIRDVEVVQCWSILTHQPTIVSASKSHCTALCRTLHTARCVFVAQKSILSKKFLRLLVFYPMYARTVSAFLSVPSLVTHRLQLARHHQSSITPPEARPVRERGDKKKPETSGKSRQDKSIASTTRTRHHRTQPFGGATRLFATRPTSACDRSHRHRLLCFVLRDASLPDLSARLIPSIPSSPPPLFFSNFFFFPSDTCRETLLSPYPAI